MSVDEDRQATARNRRAKIIEQVEAQFADARSPARKMIRDRLPRPHTIITGGDIDSLVSSAMLAAVSPWRIGMLIVKSREVLVAPGLPDPPALMHQDDVFGIDTFSFAFPSVSNHPMLFGTNNKSPQDKALRAELEKFDSDVIEHCRDRGSINPSVWCEIGARFGSKSEFGLPYKYPLGTAQLVLAALELNGTAPRLYDRQYLPWLIANCDGGLTSIRQYPWNVENWWSALAAVVGPASTSEALYRLASEQRPTEFLDVDRRLRYDEADRARSLNSRWNLASSSRADLVTATQLLRDLSGWPDPFVGGVEDLASWRSYVPSGNILPLKGMSKASEEVLLHLDFARRALHTNFSVFKERGTALGWVLPEVDPLADTQFAPPPEEAGDDDDDEQTAPGDLETMGRPDGDQLFY